MYRWVSERGTGRATVAFLVCVVALLALPPVAGAVLEGTNGRIVFASGRGAAANDDSQAKLYLRTILSGTGAGMAGEPVAASAGQHRHPTWSPDRTKIAYARGGANCAAPKCDIFILDLTTPGSAPQNVTNSANVNEDRPAWSPDGTRIAYESEVSNGSNQIDILVGPATQGTSVPTSNLTNTPAAFEGKPAWTPDSETLYYHKGSPAVANSFDIMTRPSAGGNESPVLANPTLSEFQPSISPDGASMCFTRGSGFNNTADVFTALANGGGQTVFSVDPANGDYNCTFSPDGTKIAYVNGVFTNGELVMQDFPSRLGFVTLESTPQHFDGNPDWAPDGRPECDTVSATTAFDSPVTIPLECLDTGPAYERTPTTENLAVDGGPADGTLGELQQGDPSTVTYTPNDGFSGNDSFEYFGRDERSGGPRSTVTVDVAERGEADPGAPGFSLSGVQTQKLRKRVKVTATCDAPCTANVTGQLAAKRKGKKRKRFDLAPASQNLDALAPGELKLGLSKKARKAAKKALKRDGKVKAKLRGFGEAGGNESAPVDLRIKLVRKLPPAP